MASSLRRKIEQLIKLISSVIGAIRFAFVMAIVMVCVIAFVLSLIAWPLFPPAVIIIVVLAVAGVVYIKMKESQVDEVLEKVEAFVGSDEDGDDATSHVEHLVQTLVDTVLDSISDTFLMIPLAFLAGGILMYVASLRQLGAVLIIIGIVLFLASMCLCSCVKYATHSQVRKLFADDSEASPLLE